MGRLCNIKLLFIKHMRPYECHGAIRTNDDDIKHIKKIKLISSGFISFAEMIKNIVKPVIFWYVYDQLWYSGFKSRGPHNHFVPRARPFSVSGGRRPVSTVVVSYRNACAAHDLRRDNFMVGL